MLSRSRSPQTISVPLLSVGTGRHSSSRRDPATWASRGGFHQFHCPPSGAFHSLYPGGFFEAASPSASPLPWPSSKHPGLGSQLAPYGVGNHDAAGFASCCGPLACTFPVGRLDPTLQRADLSPRWWATTKVPWCLLRPDFHRLVIVNFRTHDACRAPQHERRSTHTYATYLD